MKYSFFRKRFVNITLAFVLLAIICLWFSCSSLFHKETTTSKQILLSDDQREWMTSFFQHILLEESAIFTLFGTKPITEFYLSYYSEKEIQEWLDQLTEEERKGCIIKEDSHLEENWEKWEKIQDQFPMKRYLLFKRNHPTDPKVVLVYFVNIIETALVLQKHYDLFRWIAEEDFDPFELACNLKDENSIFWKKIFNYIPCIGILFGFGEKNSWSYYWHYIDYPEKTRVFAEAIKFSASDKSWSGKSSITNFTLPIFKSLDGLDDEVIEKYKKERKQIQKIYKNTNFLDCTLQQLVSL